MVFTLGSVVIDVTEMQLSCYIQQGKDSGFVSSLTSIVGYCHPFDCQLPSGSLRLHSGELIAGPA